MTDPRDIVAALRDVPGVAAAEVEPDDRPGGPGQLRLGLVPGVDEVAVATSVGRLLRERFGLGVDADRVQLVEDAVQAANQDSEMAEEMADVLRLRPAIRRMHLVSTGLEVSASVSLGHGGGTFTGEANGTATQGGVQRAVATATLRAVEELLGRSVRFELDQVEVAQLGRDRTVVAAVTMASTTGNERLTGAAAVREDVRQAVIRATLDALNRRVEPLLDSA